ncbi:hypothetical protein CSE_03420 [Caldisericum exile AZM16c01]|uniref:Uncharacterized protein n=1 Tax=Caldisericum exile (strain DSM 21853 / NBRC 104410 / AZM16c01) TaxID=511051 RepID=A0A7U6GDL8_CALEA|nr:hypothetical protein CSE_03420 [Caldisericum exile AZM16c01]
MKGAVYSLNIVKVPFRSPFHGYFIYYFRGRTEERMLSPQN